MKNQTVQRGELLTSEVPDTGAAKGKLRVTFQDDSTIAPEATASAPSLPPSPQSSSRRSVSLASNFSNVPLENGDIFALQKLYDNLIVLKVRPMLDVSFSDFQSVIQAMKSVVRMYKVTNVVNSELKAACHEILTLNDLLDAVLYLSKCSSFTHTRSGIQATQYKRRLMTQIENSLMLHFHQKYLSGNMLTKIKQLKHYFESVDGADAAETAVPLRMRTSKQSGIFPQDNSQK